MSVHHSKSLVVRLCVLVSAFVYVWFSFHLSVSLSICLSVCLSVYSSVYFSLSLSPLSLSGYRRRVEDLVSQYKVNHKERGMGSLITWLWNSATWWVRVRKRLHITATAFNLSKWWLFARSCLPIMKTSDKWGGCVPDWTRKSVFTSLRRLSPCLIVVGNGTLPLL